MTLTEFECAIDTGETVNQRTAMVNARIDARLSQKQVADFMQVSEATVVGWEKGYRKPRLYQMETLCAILKFAGTDQELLEVFEIPKPVKDTKMDELRRKTLKAAGVLFIPGSANLLLPVMGPEQFLASCDASIAACWTLLQHGYNNKVETLLNANMPTLTQYASTKSAYQKKAAGLATQGSILQIQLATRNLDYVAREEFAGNAANFSRISGNPVYLATAQCWLGDTYTYCYRQPEKAIAIFNKALAGLSSEAQLSKSSMYSNLAIAHAQLYDETSANKYANLARDTMPKFPEMEPLYQCLHGRAELEQFEGKAYLYLAEQSSSYGKLAFDLFNTSLGKQSASTGYRGQALIRKADAAMLIGEMQEFETCMREGLDIAIGMGSRNRMNQVRDVASRIPQKWQRETAIQTLCDDIDRANPITPA